MLKRIATRELVVGMYVARLGGSWLDHPFWKKSFLVDDPKQLALIRGAAVTEVWIDPTRGLDLPMAAGIGDEPEAGSEAGLEAEPEAKPEAGPEAALEAGTEAEARAEGAATPASLDAPASPPGPCALADELERAGRIVAQARGAMQRMFQDVRLGKAIDAEHCLPLVHEITGSVDRNPGAIVSLARLKTSDDYTYMHSVAVCALMIALARKLGLSDADTREAGIAGLVHDLGKAVMPPEILGKPGALTQEEFAVMRGHPQAGHDLLLEARGVGADALDVCLHHHEKVDGSGYPFGLAGVGLSLPARMGAVCDVYDAITSNRPYKTGWDPAVSIRKMAQWSREGHFDEAVLQAFVRSIGIYPVGSLVRLASDRLAVVVDQSPASLLTPTVTAIFRIADGFACEPDRIDLGVAGCTERIVSRESAQQWDLTGIDDHWRLAAGADAAGTG